MKNLIIAILFLFMFGNEGHRCYADSIGLNVGFGQQTSTFYGVDYQFNVGRPILGAQPYVDASLFVNKEYVQPALSAGLQFGDINIGFATAVTHWQLSIGPELGYTYNFNPLLYVKLNNSYLGTPGYSFSYTATISLGVNF